MSYLVLALACAAGAPTTVSAQDPTGASGRRELVTQRGFVDASGLAFVQQAPNDPTQLVGDLLVRDEVFLKPWSWLQIGGGLDFRVNTHDQVEDRWRLDVADRGTLRPRLAVRRLAATFTRGPLTIEAGKQFIRWGKTDIVTPTDRFAPRDFVNVVDNEFLAVTGVRAVLQAGSADTFEGAWVPRFTPSRLPLFTQRWTAVPADTTPPVTIVDGGSVIPHQSQTGIRWAHTGDGFEYSLSFFDGFNHLPNIDAALGPPITADGVPLAVDRASVAAPAPLVLLQRVYPAIRTYGGDAAVPTRWFTVKGEAAYFTSNTPGTDKYWLYVVQLERQTGEWVIVAGYAGEAVTTRRTAIAFAPDRGLTRSIVARASYTIDPVRSLAFEAAVRQNGAGMYGKAEYSQARGGHWRATVAAVVLAGRSDDFLGEYRRNSHVNVALRYSF